MLTIDQVVGVHDRADMTLLDRHFKRGQVDFMQRPLLKDRVGVMPQELRVIAEKMLYRRTYTLLLHAKDVAGCDISRQERVFAEVLKVTPVPRRTIDIDTRAEHVVHPARPRIAPDPRTYPRSQPTVPACCQAYASSVGRRREARVGPRAVWPVRHLKCRQIYRRYRLCRKPSSANVSELLLGRHLPNDCIDPPLFSRGKRMRGLCGKNRVCGEQESVTGKISECHQVCPYLGGS